MQLPRFRRPYQEEDADGLDGRAHRRPDRPITIDELVERYAEPAGTGQGSRVLTHKSVRRIARAAVKARKRGLLVDSEGSAS